jgi:hypothetical protein
MRKLLLSAAVVVGVVFAAISAQAGQIIHFGQTSGSNTVTGTASISETKITTAGTPVSIDQIAAPLATPIPAFLSLTAFSSFDGAIVTGGTIVEHFNGNFKITANADGTGTNYLSGTFFDEVNTTSGATSFDIVAPDDTFTSDVITALNLPRSLSFSLTNVTPAVSLVPCAECNFGQTINSFTASIGGSASAFTAPVPEPAAFTLFGTALFGLGLLRHRRGD